jgi:hypothetical protein
MDEVVGHLDTYQGVSGSAFVAHVNSDGPRVRRDGAHGTAEGDHVVPATEQVRREGTSDEARGPGDGNDHREPFPREGSSIAAEQPGLQHRPTRKLRPTTPWSGRGDGQPPRGCSRHDTIEPGKVHVIGVVGGGEGTRTLFLYVAKVWFSVF